MDFFIFGKEYRGMDIKDRHKITYADPNDPLFKQILIRSIESISGKKRLLKMYERTLPENRGELSFWQSAIEVLGVDLQYDPSKLEMISDDEPLVVIANHPFGILDGLVICYLTEKVRPKFKILTNSVLCQAEQLEPYLLPIDFAPTKDAMRTNIETKQKAIKSLSEGEAVIIFPAGGVSTAQKIFGKAFDDEWKLFPGKLIQASKATVLPLYFHGQNSRIFHWASHISQSLRLSLLVKELINKVGKPIKIELGEPLPFSELAQIKDRKKLMLHLRDHTYSLPQVYTS